MTVRAKHPVGAFAGGCLVVVIFFIAAVLLSMAAAAYFYNKAVHRFTSPQAENVQRVRPRPDELRRAAANLDRLYTALANNREETVYFSAQELNALLAGHPDFTAFRGRVAVALDNSLVTLELSVPLDAVQMPGLRHRWFNGTTRFAFNYSLGEFTFVPKTAQAAGSHFPDWLLTSEFGSGFRRSFSQSFSKGFHKSVQKNAQAARFWNAIRSITVEGDKLVVKTQKTAGLQISRPFSSSSPRPFRPERPH